MKHRRTPRISRTKQPPDSVDRYVGSRGRMRRLTLGEISATFLTRDGHALARAFVKIDVSLRRRIVDLVEQIAVEEQK